MQEDVHEGVGVQEDVHEGVQEDVQEGVQEDVLPTSDRINETHQTFLD